MKSFHAEEVVEEEDGEEEEGEEVVVEEDGEEDEAGEDGMEIHRTDTTETDGIDGDGDGNSSAIGRTIGSGDNGDGIAKRSGEKNAKMNSTELPQEVQEAIVIFHHISGVLFFLVNSIVIFLILIYVDSRGRAYRKYLLPLQASSTLLDLFGNGYSPIIQVNCRALYSDSRLAEHVDIVTFITIEVFLFAEVGSFYFACFYYRRNVVLLPGSRFCYRGWRRVLIFLSLQECTCVICTIVRLFAKSMKDDAEAIPQSVQWLSNKVAFILFRESPLIYVAGAMAICYGLLIVALVAAMLLQMLLELKNGMHHASISTKKLVSEEGRGLYSATGAFSHHLFT
ncbi:hypothetical protein PRIPAC_80596 [Pristionchus pacificus]|uniref:G protein-coupled receptor n=1 Tax=Pristionchus pacificus TaxID=54126 RepID=A0A2A6C2P6_PRIPA|nr:hypothetical protein PRIPAC_80596 [Pristionchus pacificus]|eukprot:PDM72301.1 G protein-coupled receptor [Pristionchus pacificus]